VNNLEEYLRYIGRCTLANIVSIEVALDGAFTRVNFRFDFESDFNVHRVYFFNAEHFTIDRINKLRAKRFRRIVAEKDC